MYNTIVTDTITKPGHKSIGSNGSFWLPPEMKNQEFHKLLPAGKKPSPETGAKLSSENLKDSFSHSKNVTLSKKNTLSVEKPIRNQAAISIRNDSQFLQTTIPSSTLPQSSNSFNRSTLNTINSFFSQSPSFPEQSNNVPFQSVYRHYSTNQNIRKQSKVVVGGGTKNAFVSADADYYRKESESTLRDKSGFKGGELIFEELTSVLFSTHPEKFNMLSLPEGQVVRFAVDLPNGHPVSVRIFSDSKRIQISFICPEKQAFDYISSTFFSPKINSSLRNELPVEVLLFSSLTS